MPDDINIHMAQQLINIGTVPNDGTGQTLRTAFQKVNSNFTELYGNISGTPDAVASTVVQRDGNANISVNTIIFHNGYTSQLDFPTANTTVNSGMVAYSSTDNALFYSNGTAWIQTIDSKDNLVTIPNDITVVGNISGNVSGYSVGYRDVPQIAGSNFTLQDSDSGKHVYSTTSGTETITIPSAANATIAIGSTVQVIVNGTGSVTLQPEAPVSLYLAGNSTPGSRSVGSRGMATVIKVATNTWFVSGVGIT